ncbi:MAG: hypothetical protein CK546_06860 [Pedosphaera sp.]|nr:hypothetical protein [Pedosphaera sp.]PHX94453.1 MAG: hypothetical protein CK546_06860 [Pedosphaera sp.]
MKTPRELLLKRHEAALPKLDALRTRAGDWKSPARASQPSTLNFQPASLWERLFGPNPLAWAGLAAVWLVLLAINRSGSEAATSSTSRASQPSEAAVAEIVRENRRQMAELLNLDEPQAAPTPRTEQHPKRSQRRENIVVV